MMSILLSASNALYADCGVTISTAAGSLGQRFLFPYGSDAAKLEVGLPPLTGARDGLGDRPCEHVNFKGSVAQKATIPYSSHDFGSGYLLPAVKVGTVFLAVLTMGDHFVLPDTQSVNGSFTFVQRDKILSVQGTPARWTVVSSYTLATLYKGQPYTANSYTTTYVYEGAWTGVWNSYSTTVKRVVTGSSSSTQYIVFNFFNMLLSSTLLSPETVTTRLSQIASTLYLDLPEPPPNFRSSVLLDAVEACRVIKINALALGKDLTSLHEVAKWVRSLSKISSFTKGARAYLGYQYGAPLTVKDIFSVVRSFQASCRLKQWRGHMKARSRSSFTATSVSYPTSTWKWDKTVKIVYDPVDTVGANVVRSLSNYGLFPSARNVWDFIPYSFTLDWIVNVSDYLATIDAEEYLHTVNIRGVVESDRVSTTIPATTIDSSLQGDIEVIFYNRYLSTSVLLDDPSFSLQNPSNHLVEGGALILARHK